MKKSSELVFISLNKLYNIYISLDFFVRVTLLYKILNGNSNKITEINEMKVISINKANVLK